MAASDAFVSYLAAKKPLVESWIEEHAWDGPADEPCSADLDRYLYEPLARYNAGGGKRVRPILALLGAEAVGGRAEDALAAGCAVELFQSAALIHDDIADEGELRRGVPCLHRTEGVGLAVNVGDAALVEVVDAILSCEELNADVRLRVLRALVNMERRTLEGQALDLGWVRDGRWDVSSEDYLAMATRKTAYYSAAVPLLLGAVCGGGSERQAEALFDFGLDAGVAFQLTDDLLNLVGSKEAQGKDYRSDLTEGKRTMAVTRSLEVLDGTRRDELLGILAAHTTDQARLERAVQLMREAGAVEHVSVRARELAQRAVERLADVELAPEARDTLASMAHFFVERSA